jgi:hypothetical protein
MLLDHCRKARSCQHAVCVCDQDPTAGQAAPLDFIGPMLDDWDRLSNDEKAEVRAIAPLFVEKLEQLRSSMDQT